MHTHAASDEPSPHVDVDAMTSDIDFTVDLDAPPSETPTRVQRPERSTPPSPAPTPIRAQMQSAPRAEPRLPIAPGRVLCDRYVLTQIIGIGGMCTVFRARDLEALPGSGKPAFVALKTPRPDYPHRERAIERLRREFEHAQRLTHLGIVQVFELANEGDIWFMTMELLEGESLAALMRREAGALAPYLVRRVLRGIGDALCYAHAAGIAHGDLNPANVFVLGGERVKLIDFGAACRDGEVPTAAATLAYASPQVLEGAAPELRDDMFSFAAIAYEMVTGRHPFEQRSSLTARSEGMRPETPSALTSEQALALMSALAFDRETRPNNIKAFAKTLAPDTQRVRTIPLEQEIEMPAPDRSDDKRWWLLAAACLIAMATAVAFTRLS